MSGAFRAYALLVSSRLFGLALPILIAAIFLGQSSIPSSAQSVVTPTCPPGFVLQGGLCVSGTPTPTCPPGFSFVGGRCLPNNGAQPVPPVRDLATELQAELKRLGCLRGRVDGIWGRGSRSALRQFGNLTGQNLGSQPSQGAINSAQQYGAGYCTANAAPPQGNPNRGGSEDWYAIAISSTSRSEAQRVANRLGAGWFVMNTRECPNFRNGYWIATAGGYSASVAQQYVRQAGGDAYRKTCN
ncbi:MAG: peptidoglycan-binding domain-containing protein [Pseudomonadota bacterium]